MNRDDVLRVAKECGISEEPRPDRFAIGDFCSQVSIERFAAAMYAKGAEDMRERAVALCVANGEVASDVAWPTWLDCEAAMASLHITPTNTEGEQG